MQLSLVLNALGVIALLTGAAVLIDGVLPDSRSGRVLLPDETTFFNLDIPIALTGHIVGNFRVFTGGVINLRVFTSEQYLDYVLGGTPPEVYSTTGGMASFEADLGRPDTFHLVFDSRNGLNPGGVDFRVTISGIGPIPIVAGAAGILVAWGAFEFGHRASVREEAESDRRISAMVDPRSAPWKKAPTNEKKLALIPRVFVTRGAGSGAYGLLLTDTRMIFVMEASDKARLGAILGGAIGSAIAKAATSRRYVQYDDSSPGLLARRRSSLVVPYKSLKSVTLKQTFRSFQLQVDYAMGDGKERRIVAAVTPPKDMLDWDRSRGVKPKETAEKYARSLQATLRSTIPSSVDVRRIWLL